MRSSPFAARDHGTMKRVLVTGAQGLTGRSVVAEVLAAEPAARVIGVGRSPASERAFTHRVGMAGRTIDAPVPRSLRAPDPARYDYVTGDLGDRASVAELVARTQPDVVIHLAAALRDDPPDGLLRNNVDATRHLIGELARLPVAPRVILGSSGSVYGRAPLPYREDGTYAPVDPYAHSKLAAEIVAKLIAGATGLPLIIARIFNIVGPGMDERHVCARFAQQAIAIAAGRSAPILEVGNLAPRRDFIDVADVAHALVALARSGSPGQAYNVASGIETTIAEVLDIILRETGLAGTASIVERYVRRDDLLRQQPDISRLRALGLGPPIPLADSLRAVVAYYRDDVAPALAAVC
jgi:GDP-4-dehydro-6-deoxy-D-mannose reductase